MASAFPAINFSDFLVRDEEKKVLPWDRFHHWISCFCVVTFDLELGQVIEKIFPDHVTLTEKEKSNICYLAFPDSNTGCMGDTQFFFRIRSSPRCGFIQEDKVNERDLPVALKRDDRHFYGFVSFRQVKDASLKRGYFQKSLVLLSRLPYKNLFTYVVQLTAPEYFENGDVAVESVCHQIDHWQFPVPSQTLQVPLMGNILQVRVPSKKDKPGAVASPEKEIAKQISIPSPLIFPSLNDACLFKSLFPVLAHIHVLWELVLLGEPIVAMAPSPSMCSEAVHSLVSLILPLKYASDYRPYFTIHDSEFKEYTTRTQTPPSVILGVTNPFFAKTLQNWPHILRIGDMPSLTISKNNSTGSSSRKVQELKPGIYTKYKPMLDRDKSIFKNLAKGSLGQRPMEAQDAMVRRHMLELTQSFMIPLERYIGSLMPLQRSISPWKTPPKLRKFNIDEFLRTLGHFGPQLTSKLKGNWTGLYKKFFHSPNFEAWFKNRRSEVNQKLQILHLEALCAADILKWVWGREEVEVVDLYMQLKQKLIKAQTRDPPLTMEMRRQLKSHMDKILSTLPMDLQVVLKQS